LQTPGRTGLLHQIGNTGYVIPDTNNTTGSVGGTTTPIYVEAGVIKPLSYTIAKSVPADAIFTDHYAWSDITSKPDTATRWPEWNEIAAGADVLPEGTSSWTDNTEILTSYASNNGFADTNSKGVVYRRDALCAYNYIKSKLDSVYVAKSVGVTNVAWDSTNQKITKTINGTTSDVVTAATLKAAINVTAGDLGLSSALRYRGTTTTAMSDGLTTAKIKINNADFTPSDGGVVIYDDAEYLWTGSLWELIGAESSFKKV
jgi:hypothetical protein